MITIAHLLAGFVVAGFLGSVLEKIGVELNLPRMIAAGKAIESIAADAPKFITNIYGTFKGKPS
jgi:hypothetical protein